MDNQHKFIKGYRDLSKAEVDAMNEGKSIAQAVGDYCIKRREQIIAMPTDTVEQRADRDEAMRWLNDGEITAQKAFMSLIRSIALPSSF